MIYSDGLPMLDDCGARQARRLSARSRSRADAAVLLGALWMSGCGGPECRNEAFYGLPSPDGTSIAFVFYRKCAGSTETTTEVTVSGFHSALRNEPGNVLAVGTEQPVRVAWVGPARLVVSGFGAPVYRRNAQAGAVAIEFRSKDNSAPSAPP